MSFLNVESVSVFSNQIFEIDMNDLKYQINRNNLYDEDDYEYKHKPVSQNINKKSNLNKKNNSYDKKSNLNRKNNLYEQPPIIFADDLFKQIFGNLDELEKSSSAKSKTPLCNNPQCDHSDYEENEPHYLQQQINVSTIDDLITLGKTYHCKKNKEYNGVSLRILCDLVGPLNELKDMIGMKTVKESIFNQIVFFLQGLNKRPT